MTEWEPTIRDLAFAQVGDSERLGKVILRMHYDRLLEAHEGKFSRKAARRTLVGFALTALMAMVLDLKILLDKRKIVNMKPLMFEGLSECANIIGVGDATAYGASNN